MKAPKRRDQVDATAARRSAKSACTCQKPTRSGAIVCELHNVFVPAPWPTNAAGGPKELVKQRGSEQR